MDVVHGVDLCFIYNLAAKDESLGGTYKGTDPMGLLWSMRPIPGSQQGLR